MKGLDTNTGTNALAVVTALLAGGEAMPPTTRQWYMPLMLLILALIFWLIKGSGIEPGQGEKIKQEAMAKPDEEAPVSDRLRKLLEDGRG